MKIALSLVAAALVVSLFGCKPKSPDDVPECAAYIKALKECSNGPAGSTEEDVFRKTWSVSVAAHSMDEVKAECKTHEQETRASCTKAVPPVAPKKK